MAQGDDPDLAEAALYALGRIDDPHAVHGLQTVAAMLAPEPRALAERALLKLQLKGVPIEPLPPPDPRWRALVSPPDGEGNRVVWMVSDPDAEGECSFVGVSISESEGIIQTYGRHRVSAQLLPERAPLGQVHNVSLGRPPESQEDMLLHLLEADFDYGRRLIHQGQRRALAIGGALPVEYRLLGMLLWAYDLAGLDQEPPSTQVPEEMGAHLEETLQLFGHPGFRGWHARGEIVVKHATAMLQWMPLVFLEGVASWAQSLAEEYFDPDTLIEVGLRLEAMQEWLERAQEPKLAQLAAIAARTVTVVPPAEHPFTLRIAEMGLNLFLEQAQMQMGSNRKKEN
jgi:hypothetical protein